MSGIIRPAPRPIMRFAVENFVIIPRDLRGNIPLREDSGFIPIAHFTTERGVSRLRIPSTMKRILCASPKLKGRKGKKPGIALPIPDAIVNVIKERLKVAGLVSSVVLSAKYAFQVAKYIASPIPPITADASSTRKFVVIPGMMLISVAREAPLHIMLLRPYRSESTANGILKTTVVNPEVASNTPRSVTETPSSGRNTVMAT